MASLRKIYQSELLYCSTGTNATGALQSNAVWGLLSGSITSGTNYIAELYRVQKIDNGWNKKVKILNQFGQLGAVDLPAIDPPEVTLSFSYVLANLANEKLLGLNVNSAGDATSVGCISGILANNRASQNYFIKSMPEGSDAINNNSNQYGVFAFGNTFLGSYTTQGKVLDFPTVDVTLAALNFQAQNVYQDGSGPAAITPAIYPASGIPVTGWGYTLPTGVTSFGNAGLSSNSGLSVLRPGDINLNLGLNAGDGLFDPGDIKIQDYNLSFNLNLEDLPQLGSKFFYAKLPKFPVEATLTVNALAGDLQTGSLVEIFNNNTDFNPSITLNRAGTSTVIAYYKLAGAKFDAQSSSLTIGSNKTVTLTFRSTIGGPSDLAHNVFMSGIC